MNAKVSLQPDRQRFDADRAPLIVVLLLVQAAIGSLETLVTLALVGAAPIGAGLALLGAALAGSLLIVAAGVVLGGRWTRVVATGFEALVLTGAALHLLVRHGSLPGLVWLLSDVALPIAVLDLLWIRLAPAAVPAATGAPQDAASRQASPAGGSHPAPQA